MPDAPTKFIVNYSMGFEDSCAGSASGQPCQPPSDRMPSATTRAFHATTWKEMTAARWPDFLMVVAAGNEGLEESTTIYPAMGDAQFGTPMAIAAFPDPTLGFVDRVQLWDPRPAFAANGFLSLAGDAAQVASDLHARGLDTPASVAPNVVVVASANNMLASNAVSKRVTPEQLVQSGFSDRNADVLAVGEELFGVPRFKGTSLSAPQVTGLASYLWLLSPDLRALPPAITRQAILQNARNAVIDAYATALSLDGAVGPATALVRNAILDVNHDSAFTESDIDEYLRHLYVVDANGVITNQAPASTTADFSRYDLNGDGFTTSGSRREQFDLDRVGSTQFGQTKYSTVIQDIEGQPVSFDETGLTDVEILCYYAYSPLYQGNPDARKTLLRGRCGIGITPERVTLRSGQTQIFAASEPALFTATSGTINATTGLFTAGPSGPVTVRATSIANPNLFADATVTVTAGLVFAGTVGYTEEYHYAGVSAGFPQTRDSSTRISVDVTVEMRADGTFGPVRGIGSGSLTGTQVDACYDSTKAPNPDPQFSANSTRTLHYSELDTYDVHAGTLTIDPKADPHVAVLSGEDGGTVHILQDYDDNAGGDGCKVSTQSADDTGASFLFYGRAIYDNGQLIAIDFNVDYSAEFTVAFQTGRLERQP